MAAIPFRQVVEYPESDGTPMGETQRHVEELLALLGMLWDRYRDATDVYVGGNMFLYYQEGEPRSVVCPDLFVVRGVPKEPPRRTFKLWLEGHAPSFVLELTSNSTIREDLGRKKDLYARLGVSEYVLYDPWGEELSPRLVGFRLEAGRYRPIETASDGSIASEALGLLLRIDGDELRLVDPATGTPLPNLAEAYDKARRGEEARRGAEVAREAAEARAAAEAAARRAVEEELARLRRELEDRSR